ncbi:MAG: AAA family ATPase, partial [Bacteroidia bacterium]|nr:AAA family ATPase [Bacteroidia bacterium]
MQTEQTDLLELAAQFVNSTSSNIFLTGKAGTGKTTFLRDLAERTHKNFVVVAPTGIAALNAKGVTIHSQFLLPFGTFIPENKPAGNYKSTTNIFTQHTLARMHPLNSIRKQVLRAADLLIIDEVSMLRADILDAIDTRMKSVKRNYYKSFGGTQVLMIGDLYQLPPIVKDAEWQILKSFYKSMHFFEAQALQNDGMVYIELDKIFRQQDDTFINVLNNLRNNVVTNEDIELLNNHYKIENEIPKDENVITISTHNYKADAINEREMNALPGPSSYFEADIDDDFPEKLYPLPWKLELKVGAQIMFIKNDTSGEQEYYNGKMARVDYIDDDGVTVVMADTRKQFVLRKEEWVNKKYTINALSKELEEEVIGTFLQYPVKPAWAVTVHKSQGLTFDKAIIDVGDAFAPGQVYVALSRLRSLDGLILRTKINTGAINTDRDVVVFSNTKQNKTELPQILVAGRKQYLQQILNSSFDFTLIEKQLEYLYKKKGESMDFADPEMQTAMATIESSFSKERTNTATFRRQLQNLVSQNEFEKLLSRIDKGSGYYSSFILKNLKRLIIHMSEVEQFSRTKGYLSVLSEIDQLMMQALHNMDKAMHITSCV